MAPNKKGQFWIAPRMWPDSMCFILGGGPSLKGFDIEILKGRNIIAVNQAYKLAPWIPVMFFGDCRWLGDNRKELLNFGGLKVTSCDQHANKPGLKVIKKRNQPNGLSLDPSFVVWNLSSGACAINLAVHFGVNRIVLLGFDMEQVNGKNNYHDDYKNANQKNNPYSRFMGKFPVIADSLKKANIECINACLTSKLDVFPKMSLEDVL